MATGATPAYLLAPEVSALLYYMPDQRHHMLFATMWNTGIRIGEARSLTPESFDLGGLRPFVRVLSGVSVNIDLGYAAVNAPTYPIRFLWI